MSVKRQTLSPKERQDWITLSRTERVGPHTFFQLLKLYGSAEGALDALPRIARRAGSKTPMQIPSAEKIDEEIRQAEAYGAVFIAACEDAYPDILRYIPDPPPVLTVLGDASVLERDAVAFVGTRNATANGMRFTGKLTGELVRDHGKVIVSGLARGIDAAAHQGALGASEKNSTIAVIAGGINDIYPKEHEALYWRIARGGGCIIAESAYGQPPRAHDFPRRNRIISGLAKGLVVIEATTRSGSLITAERAAEQGREVMAVPGFPMDPRAHGPNKLIKQGAALIESVEDILHTLNFAQLSSARSPFEEEDEDFVAPPPEGQVYERLMHAILNQLSAYPTQIDDVIAQLDAAPQAVLAVLLELELANRVQRHPGGKVSLVME